MIQAAVLALVLLFSPTKNARAEPTAKELGVKLAETLAAGNDTTTVLTQVLNFISANGDASAASDARKVIKLMRSDALLLGTTLSFAGLLETAAFMDTVTQFSPSQAPIQVVILALQGGGVGAAAYGLRAVWKTYTQRINELRRTLSADPRDALLEDFTTGFLERAAQITGFTPPPLDWEATLSAISIFLKEGNIELASELACEIVLLTTPRARVEVDSAEAEDDFQSATQAATMMDSKKKNSR